MVVFAYASVFDSNPFLYLFGLLFQFCRKHHAGTKQWAGTKTSSASKGWRACKINSTDFSCPAFHDALSVFHHFIAKSWIETALENTHENKVPTTGTKTVLWALFHGETWHRNTPLMWCLTHQDFSYLRNEASFNNALKLKKPIFCILRWAWSIDFQSTTTFIIYL